MKATSGHKLSPTITTTTFTNQDQTILSEDHFPTTIMSIKLRMTMQQQLKVISPMKSVQLAKSIE